MLDIKEILNEIEEFERLAEIGRATEKAFEKYPRISGNIFIQDSKKGYFVKVMNFDTVEELLEWYREVER